MAANIFQSGGGGNWGNTASWSLGTIPTAGDGHVATFDATSPNCDVDTTDRVCNNIDFTGYTNTITMTHNITVSGSITLDTGMSVAGSGQLIVKANCTLTSNGFTWPNDFASNAPTLGTITITLADDFNLGGQLHTLGVNSTTTYNGNTLYLNQGITFVFRGTIGFGTTILRFVGTGTIFHQTDTTDVIRTNPIIIDTSGTITFDTYLGIRELTFTYISGTTITAGHTLQVNQNITLNTNGSTTPTSTTSSTGINWNIVNFSNLAPVTLTSPLSIVTSHTLNRNSAISGSQIYNNGSIICTSLESGSSTTVYNLVGTGTWSGNTPFTFPLIINTSGTITLSGTVQYGRRTFTYISGTVVTTGSTLTIMAGCTLNTAGISWNNVTINAAGTYVLSSLLTMNSLAYSGAGNITFSGSFGFTTANLTCTTANKTITYVNSITYTVTNSLTLVGTSAQPILFTSNSGTIRAIVTLDPSASQNVSYTNATRIDSSAGQTILSSGGVFVNTLNWELPPSSGFFNFF